MEGSGTAVMLRDSTSLKLFHGWLNSISVIWEYDQLNDVTSDSDSPSGVT